MAHATRWNQEARALLIGKNFQDKAHGFLLEHLGPRPPTREAAPPLPAPRYPPQHATAVAAHTRPSREHLVHLDSVVVLCPNNDKLISSHKRKTRRQFELDQSLQCHRALAPQGILRKLSFFDRAVSIQTKDKLSSSFELFNFVHRAHVTRLNSKSARYIGDGWALNARAKGGTVRMAGEAVVIRAGLLTGAEGKLHMVLSSGCLHRP